MKRKIFISLLLTIIISIVCINKVSAQVFEMDDSVYERMAYDIFDLRYTKLDSYDVNNDGITFLEDDDNKKLLTFLIDHNNKNAITYEADINNVKPYLLKLAYKNVTKVVDRAIDVNIYITKIGLSDFWGSGNYYNEDGAAFLYVSETGVWVGSELNESPYRYSAHQDIDVTIEVLWSDDQTIVELPFLNTQSDIDVYYNTSSNKTKEKWKTVTGYTGDYYIFSSSKLAQDSNGAWYNTGSKTDGINSYLKTGVYAPTLNGNFSSSFHVGVCASKIEIAMQTFLLPTKTSKVLGKDNNIKELLDSLEDKIVYSLTQPFGELYGSVFVPYNSFVIIDTMDSNLNYESAEVFLNDGNENINITNDDQYGTLLYDTNNREVRYSLNPTWLSNINNYKGQIITLNITTSVNDLDKNFTNTAVTKLDGIIFSSNSVVYTNVRKQVTYKYISGTEGKELPNEISPTSGEYMIGDNQEYLVGENVNRVNGITIGSQYDVYENDKLVGSWILKNWNADSLIMSNDGAEFIGTWEYLTVKPSENPNTIDNFAIYIAIVVLSITGIYLNIKLLREKDS